MKKSIFSFHRKISAFIIVLLAALVFFACNKDDPEYQAQIDREIILKYIADNDLEASEVDDTGIFYVISKQGSGGYPTIESSVHLISMGFYFDKDDNILIFQPLASQLYVLKRQILGWQYGIPMFNRGAKGMLLIPSAYGYGPNPYYSGIPPNQVLFFDIELIDFQ
ncbi:MAG: FKBP-type peptidyl-prolyl cis-trans isomerase [Bacteroidetes bacterium]|nr:FKBP-type peptidyl-prolyl cis-trans isomerase [Bacteroidota bacterium]